MTKKQDIDTQEVVRGDNTRTELTVLNVADIQDICDDAEAARAAQRPQEQEHNIIIIGIDPATKTGISIISDEILNTYNVFNMDKINDICEAKELIRAQKDASNVFCVIEDQYQLLYKNIKKTIEIQGFFSRYCISLGYTVELIKPSVWQKAILTKANVERRILKNMSKSYANRRWTLNIQSHDIADAINIATWKLNKLKWEAHNEHI